MSFGGGKSAVRVVWGVFFVFVVCVVVVFCLCLYLCLCFVVVVAPLVGQDGALQHIEKTLQARGEPGPDGDPRRLLEFGAWLSPTFPRPDVSFSIWGCCTWVWHKFQELGLRRFWSLVPFAKVPFWYMFLSHSHMSMGQHSTTRMCTPGKESFPFPRATHVGGSFF